MEYFRNFLQIGKGQNSQYENRALVVVDKFFSITDRKSTFWGEFRGGTATFLAMAYILAVNPAILAATGGPCENPFDDTCVNEVTQDLVIATAVSSFVATLLMGVTANLPLALAPGMGLNAYFTYEVVGKYGGGNVSYETALGAVLLEGILFLLLAMVGVRQLIAKVLPKSVKYATAVGIGMFLAHIGLQQAEGIALVTTDIATGIELGGCGHRMYSDNMVCGDFLFNPVCAIGNYSNVPVATGWSNGMQGPTRNNATGEMVPVMGAKGDNYCHCDGGKMEGVTTWLGIVGFVIMSALIVKNVKGAIIIGILFVTFISWIKGHDASFFDCLPAFESACDAKYDTFKKVFEYREIKKTGGILEVHLDKKDIWIALITFFYVDVLDTTGTLYSMASYMKILDEDGNFDGMHAAFSVDAFATIIGATMGTSPVTTYIESADGIREGGRTGLASVFTAGYFFLGIFMAPVLSCVPPWGMGPALIIVGALMMKQVTQVDWEDPVEAIPAFMTIVLMPLTYSIAYGIIGGIAMSWILQLVAMIPIGENVQGRFEPAGVAEVNLTKLNKDDDSFGDNKAVAAE